MSALPSPIVSVIIATFNRSATLHYAIQSVLAQRFRDFELLVVGDACTDDSESVVASFIDNRVRWENLAENSGSQSGANNRGLALARGQYVAYLGHDDLWHPDHLRVLVDAIERESADLVFAVTEELGPGGDPTGWLFGLAPPGWNMWTMNAPPSSWLHRSEIIDRIGYWNDHRSVVLPVDLDFFARAVESELSVVAVPELTVFKFTSGLKPSSYHQHGANEQAEWWSRMQREPDLRYAELLKVLLKLAGRHPEIANRFTLPSSVSPGSIMQGYRERRGLAAMTRVSIPTELARPLCQDRTLLGYLNCQTDVMPGRYREALVTGAELPEDGLFIGYNWHSLEADRSGLVWRWMDVNAQVVITRPSGRYRQLAISLAPGPCLDVEAPRLQLTDLNGRVRAETVTTVAETIRLDAADLPPDGTTLMLTTPDGGRLIPGDSRVLNFRVFSIDWAESQPTF